MPNQPVRVLYIDDDPALVRLAQRVLGRRGYTVEHASTAEAGLARLESGEVDVIALDHYLPTGTGLDVLASLSPIEGAPPVVYVTGSDETAVAVDALKLGAADYVLKTTGGDFLEFLGSAIDQALEKSRLQKEKARAEREVRDARDRAEILLAEVNHRVANSLALVAALVGMQANSIADQTVKDALTEAQVRISAIAGVHRRLYTSVDVRSVEIGEYMRALIEDLDLSMKAAGHRSLVRLDVDAFAVPTDKVVSLGVIVTELVTNAFKYAYPAPEAGEIRVSLHRQGAQVAFLAVEDDGVGWTGVGKPQGTGLGSRIVKAMATNLGSTVRYEEVRGTRVSVEFPL